MLRQLFAFGFALIAWNATAEIVPTDNPLETIIALEIEKMELEFDLFGTAFQNEEEISIESIAIYEIEEDVNIDFDTTEYLPEGFNARKGMDDIDWSTIELYEIEEELDLDFDTKDHLPKGFNPYKGMTCESRVMLSSRL